eukprot:1136609-Pleurochrysis_carterae.AAC.1
MGRQRLHGRGCARSHACACAAGRGQRKESDERTAREAAGNVREVDGEYGVSASYEERKQGKKEVKESLNRAVPKAASQEKISGNVAG